jgi:YYY domain-containing protein
MMDVPFFGLVIALAVAYVQSVRARQRAQSWVLVGFIGLFVGLVRTLHTWDFPTAALIGFGAIAAGQVLVHGRWQTRWWVAVAQMALAAGVLVVLFSPYNAHFETFDPGVIRSPATTKTQQYFAQFGLFVAFAVAFLAVRYREELVRRLFDHGRNPFLATVNGKLELGALCVFVVGLSAFTWTFGLTTIALGVMFELFLFNLVWMELRSEQADVPRLLVTVMFVFAFGISVGVDVVTLKNDVERMNTVFKFYIQAWQLFALASAFAAWYVGRALWQIRGWRIRPAHGRMFWTLAATAVIGVLLVGASVFVVSGTAVRQNARFAETGPTLNGLAYLKQAQYREVPDSAHPDDVTVIRLEDDEPLIRWLRANVQGSPVITEAVGDLYHWTGRMSWNTGLPAVIGWDFHQTQQRAGYVDLVDQRRFQTAQFYTDGNLETAEQYLLRYNVSYVIVGTEEHVHGTPVGLSKIAQMPELSAVFRSGDNVIYKVDQSKLPPPIVTVAPGG